MMLIGVAEIRVPVSTFLQGRGDYLIASLINLLACIHGFAERGDGRAVAGRGVRVRPREGVRRDGCRLLDVDASAALPGAGAHGGRRARHGPRRRAEAPPQQATVLLDGGRTD